MNNFDELNYQQQRFCDEYLVSFNAFSAAICAGYSENTARKAELLHNPKIQAYLKLGMEKTRQRLEITHDMILREFAKVAFSNMGNYYDERGAIKPMCCLTSDEKAAVSYYQIMDSLDQDGNRVGEFGKIKLHNKMSALDKIARHVGFYAAEKRQESRGKNKDEGRNQSQESRGKNQERELEREAYFETPESRTKNQEESLVVNGDGELVAEVANDEALVQVDGSGDLDKSSATAGKILTLSPLPDARAEIREPVTRIEKPQRWSSLKR